MSSGRAMLGIIHHMEMLHKLFMGHITEFVDSLLIGLAFIRVVLDDLGHSLSEDLFSVSSISAKCVAKGLAIFVLNQKIGCTFDQHEHR